MERVIIAKSHSEEWALLYEDVFRNDSHKGYAKKLV